METSTKFGLGALVLIAGGSMLIAAACSSTSSSVSPPIHENPDTSTVSPEFCMDECNSEANSGTLTGTYAQCLSTCCEAHPGCPNMDSGSSNDTGVHEPMDSGSQTDGATKPDSGGCATPCNGHCCGTDQACSNDMCVPTCTKASDCSSTGCCAPLTNAAGDPVGPYICKPNDGSAYDCCDGIFNDCSGNYCCVTDSNSNEFCALPCTMDSMCTPGHCDPEDFGTFTTTCSGSTACGP